MIHPRFPRREHSENERTQKRPSKLWGVFLYARFSRNIYILKNSCIVILRKLKKTVERCLKLSTHVVCDLCRSFLILKMSIKCQLHSLQSYDPNCISLRSRQTMCTGLNWWVNLWQFVWTEKLRVSYKLCQEL